MSAHLGSELRAEPNLTPLLDVVFQLITFFMLLINFSQDNLRLSGSGCPSRARRGPSRPGRPSSTTMRLVLNIDRDGKLLFNREALSDTEATAKIKEIEAQLARIEKLSRPRSPGCKIKPERWAADAWW